MVVINPKKHGSLKYVFSNETKEFFPDMFKGAIVRSDNIEWSKKDDHAFSKKSEVLSRIEGEWTNHIIFDDTKYWVNGDVELSSFVKPDYPIPSDSSYREDLQALIEGNEDKSQEQKEKYEEIQRLDRKLREQYEKDSKKKKKK